VCVRTRPSAVNRINSEPSGSGPKSHRLSRMRAAPPLSVFGPL
jgi:hypothetical protein